jgi:hypothetical protein
MVSGADVPVTRAASIKIHGLKRLLPNGSDLAELFHAPARSFELPKNCSASSPAQSYEPTEHSVQH